MSERTNGTGVESYVAEIPSNRRPAFDAVLRLVREHLPPGYEETMNWGMVCWQVPLDIYPDTYNKQPMMLCGLANRKSYISLHLVPVYLRPDTMELLQRSGRKLRMGKGCLNFTAAEELPLAEIGEIIRSMDVETFVATAKASRTR